MEKQEGKLFQIFFYNELTAKGGNALVRAFDANQAQIVFAENNPNCLITWIRHY